MSLLGVDPNDPTPSVRRELIFGAGPGSSGVTRDVVLYGHSTAAGSENDNELNEPIADDADARTRFGDRSELYGMYRKFVEVDSSATIYGMSVPDPAGTAAAAVITVVGVSDADSTVTVTILGEDIVVSVANGDALAATATAIQDAVNAHDEGRLPMTANAVAGVVTITAANTGIRSEFAIAGDSLTRAIRVKIKTTGAVNTQTVVKTVGSAVAGVGEDDGSTAFGLTMAKDNIYWHVAPWHTNNGAGGYGSDIAVSATDNQIGELLLNINTQALPANSKEKQAVFGLVETNAAAIVVAGDASVNTVRGSFFWQQNNDWTPAMIAAHNAGVMRAGYISHPARNRAGYAQGEATPYNLPPPAVATDVPTATEIRTALNNGVSPISFIGTDRPVSVRPITSRHLNTSGAFDYKAREHHITYVMDFVWSEIKSRWEAQKQEFVADDPAQGALPILNTTTPRDLRGLINGVIDTMTSSKPLGIYDGPILAPDQIQLMKDSVTVSKIPAGLSVVAEFIAVQHLLKFEGKFLEIGEAY